MAQSNTLFPSLKRFPLINHPSRKESCFVSLRWLHLFIQTMQSWASSSMTRSPSIPIFQCCMETEWSTLFPKWWVSDVSPDHPSFVNSSWAHSFTARASLQPSVISHTQLEEERPAGPWTGGSIPGHPEALHILWFRCSSEDFLPTQTGWGNLEIVVLFFYSLPI